MTSSTDRPDAAQSAGRPTAAVIGSGVSGLTAAHLLSRTHAVTLYEADNRFGGHAHTHDVGSVAGPSMAVDSGFIVHNERSYPTLRRLFAELGVRTRPTQMSMSITCDGCGLTYAGGRGLSGILAQPQRAADPRFVRMLAEVPRFHRRARSLLCAPAGLQPTWGEFLAEGGFSPFFVRHFAVPLVSCVWSSGDADARDYPARHLFAFLSHHGMLSVKGSPTWQTVVGGSRTYVDAVVERLPDVRRSTPVVAVARHDDGVDVRCADDSLATYDRVVVATHADDALDLLADVTVEEKTDLAAFTYSTNPTWLHRDGSVLPANRRARASWNYRMHSCTQDSSQVLVSYWMNRLQGLPGDDLVVTLNPRGRVDPTTVVSAMTYRHPVFTTQAVAAATRLVTAGGPRLAFAGAHLGWGFHEDGCRSGADAALRLGGRW